jgi:hypothetical protein
MRLRFDHRPMLWLLGIGLAQFCGFAAKAPPGAEVFTPGPIRTIRIDITGEALAALQRENRQYAKATFHDGETAVREVGVHLKGAAGSFRQLDDRPALTVNFGKFVSGQRWHGLQKIHLNNSVQDDTLLTENICGELFRRAGVPAPRVSNARVILNGRQLGIYVLIEGFDKTFLRQYYANRNGNLYDGGFCQDIDRTLEKLGDKESKDQPELKALADAARDPDLHRRWTNLQQRLNLDRFISFCALDVMTWDWDGYVMKPNNYKLYWDPDSGRVDFFPHGMDQMFGEPNGPILPYFNGLVARGVIETPEGRRRYVTRMTELLTNVFEVTAITNRINRYAAPIRAALAERDPEVAKGYDWQVERLRDRVRERITSVARQLKELTPADLKPSADAGPAGDHDPAGATAAFPVRRREATSTRLAQSVETPPPPAVFH